MFVYDQTGIGCIMPITVVKKNQHPTTKNTGRRFLMQRCIDMPILLLKIIEYQVVTLGQYLNQRLTPLTKKAEP
jgi:hypothetical protein